VIFNKRIFNLIFLVNVDICQIQAIHELKEMNAGMWVGSGEQGFLNIDLKKTNYHEWSSYYLGSRFMVHLEEIRDLGVRIPITMDLGYWKKLEISKHTWTNSTG
jgi:hypothetical protein